MLISSNQSLWNPVVPPLLASGVWEAIRRPDDICCWNGRRVSSVLEETLGITGSAIAVLVAVIFRAIGLTVTASLALLLSPRLIIDWCQKTPAEESPHPRTRRQLRETFEELRAHLGSPDLALITLRYERKFSLTEMVEFYFMGHFGHGEVGFEEFKREIFKVNHQDMYAFLNTLDAYTQDEKVVIFTLLVNYARRTELLLICELMFRQFPDHASRLCLFSDQIRRLDLSLHYPDESFDVNAGPELTLSRLLDRRQRNNALFNIQPEELLTIFERCPNLEYVDLSYQQFPSELYLTRIAQACPNLRSLKMGVTLLQPLPPLQPSIFVFENNFAFEDGLSAVARNIPQLQSLETLCLADLRKATRRFGQEFPNIVLSNAQEFNELGTLEYNDTLERFPIGNQTTRRAEEALIAKWEDPFNRVIPASEILTV